jgi:hypothetical protein
MRMKVAISLGSFVVLLGCCPPNLPAGLLNPNDYQSLGSLTTVAGIYTINTTSETLTDPGGNVLFRGVTAGGGALFDFSSINIAPGSFIAVQGANPLILLSQGNATIAGEIQASSGVFNFTNVGPGARPTGAVAGTNMVYPSEGGDNNTSGSGGGGFGSAGGMGFAAPLPPPGGAGGPANGDLLNAIQGGTAGAALPGQYSLGGGGGVEVGAVGTLALTGSIDAEGQLPIPTSIFVGSGGGSGGGVLLFGQDVSILGTIDVAGGPGGPSYSVGHAIISAGGPGGGGRVLIAAYDEVPTFDPSLINTGYGSLITMMVSVPEPSSLVMGGTAVIFGLVGVLRRRERAAA